MANEAQWKTPNAHYRLVYIHCKFWPQGTKEGIFEAQLKFIQIYSRTWTPWCIYTNKNLVQAHCLLLNYENGPGMSLACIKSSLCFLKTARQNPGQVGSTCCTLSDVIYQLSIWPSTHTGHRLGHAGKPHTNEGCRAVALLFSPLLK